jgi:hypothetical protein
LVEQQTETNQKAKGGRRARGSEKEMMKEVLVTMVIGKVCPAIMWKREQVIFWLRVLEKR